MKVFAATARRGRPRARPAPDRPAPVDPANASAADENAADDNAIGGANRKNIRDEGTPELRRMRLVLADGADPVMSAHPLALLLARGLIDARQHQAGLRFGVLYRLAVGRADISYQRLYEGLAGESGAGRGVLDDARLALARLRYLRARAVLEREGNAVARDTENLTIFGAWPAFLLRPAPINENRANENRAPGPTGHLIRLRRGLDALDRGTRMK